MCAECLHAASVQDTLFSAWTTLYQQPLSAYVCNASHVIVKGHELAP